MRRALSIVALLTACLFAADVGAAGSKGCANPACHKKVHKGRVVHGPVKAGACTGCHRPRGKMPTGKHAKNAFTLIKGDGPCLGCHRDIAKGLKQGGHVHKPLKRDGCLKCHKPHSTNTKFLLKGGSIADQCGWCHKKSKMKFPFVHGPVASGSCTFCHSPHASKAKYLLTSTGPKLCFGCHDAERFKPKFKHKALEKGCTSCHDPHGSKHKYFIRDKSAKLCGKCHKKVFDLASKAKHKHEAIKTAGCAGCHDPHGSKHAHLMKSHPVKVCAGCHKKVLAGGKLKHGPVKEGDCGACHQPHGGKHVRMLNEPFPAAFYGPFSAKRYGICFECHEAQITKDKYTATLTKFRDGKRNLHYLHVVAPGNNKRKGRSCKTCHEVHAGPQARHIRQKVPFGTGGWELPIKFTKTKHGGSCVVGCHSPKSYARDKK